MLSDALNQPPASKTQTLQIKCNFMILLTNYKLQFVILPTFLTSTVNHGLAAAVGE